MSGVRTVTGAPAAAYLGTWMRNPNGLNAARVSRDAAVAGGSRKLMGRLVLAATCTTVPAPGVPLAAPRTARARTVGRVVARIAAALTKPRPRRRQAA